MRKSHHAFHRQALRAALQASSYLILAAAVLLIANGIARGAIDSAATGIVSFIMLVILAPLGELALTHRRRMARPGCCQRCGYDTRMTPFRCPECGFQWTWMKY